MIDQGNYFKIFKKITQSIELINQVQIDMEEGYIATPNEQDGVLEGN